MKKYAGIMESFRNLILRVRNLVFLCYLCIFVYEFVKWYVAASERLDYPVAGWFTFAFNDGFFRYVVYLLMIILVYSEVPFTQEPQIYRLFRLGRHGWCREKYFMILFAAVLMTLLPHMISIMMIGTHLDLTMDWGRLLYTEAYMHVDPGITVSDLVISRMTPLRFMLENIGLTFLCVWLIGNLMFTVCLWFSRIAAIMTAAVLTVLTIMVQNMFLFKHLIYLSPLSWAQTMQIYERIYDGMPTPTVAWSVCALVAANLFCIAAGFVRMHSIDYSVLNERR